MACRSYCEHGGVCILDEGHEGLHDSDYCQWDDEHALTKEAADALLIEANPDNPLIGLIADLT
jgi:hypothetical protein